MPRPGGSAVPHPTRQPTWLPVLLLVGLSAPGLEARRRPARPTPPPPPASGPPREPSDSAPAREGSALATLARVRLAAGDRRGALDAARRGYQVLRSHQGPAAADLSLELGEALAALEEEGLALLAFQRAMDADPEGDRVDDALYAKAALKARGLPDPKGFRAAIGKFLAQDPLILDQDALVYFMGFSVGVRLTRVRPALEALEQVWKQRPEGDRSAHARLHAALIRGFSLDDPDGADTLLEDLAKAHPHSSLLGLASVVRAFVAAGRGRLEEAVEHVSGIAPEDGASREGALLGAILSGYYLEDGPRALRFLDHLERTPGTFSDLARFHRSLLLMARISDYPQARQVLSGLEGSEEVPKGWIEALSGALDGILATTDPAERAYRVGRFFERIGHQPRARKEFEAVVRDHPGSLPEERARLRLAALDQDDRGELGAGLGELESLASSTRLAPSHRAEARWRLARARLAHGASPTDAFGGELDARDPFSLPALRGLLLHSEDGSTERVRLLRDLADELDPLDPNRPRVLLALATTLERNRAIDHALRVYQTLLPDRPEVATAIRRLEDSARVEALAPGGQEPIDPEDRLRLAYFYMRLGETGTVERLLEGVRRSGPTPGSGSGEARASTGTEASVPARAAALLAHLLHVTKARPERIREILEEALARPELPERDRLSLLELKAGRLAELEPESARSIRRALVKAGYKVRTLVPGLVEHEAEARGAQSALSLLRHLGGELAPDPRLTELVADLYDKAGAGARARDARTRLVEAWPATAEAARARKRLAADDAERISQLARSRVPGERKVDALEEALRSLADAEQTVVRPAVDALLASIRPEATPELALRVAGVLAGGLADPAAARPWLELAAAGPEDLAEEALLALGENLAATGDPRGALAALERAGEKAGRIGVRARRARARLLEEAFGDPAGAAALTESALAVGVLDQGEWAALVEDRVRQRQKAGADAAELAKILAEGASRLTDPGLRTPLETRLARILEDLGQPEKAGEEWLRLSERLPDPAERSAATLRGLEQLFAAGRDARVSSAASAFLASAPSAPDSEAIRTMLRKASARAQVATLLGAVNWGDPESRDNLTRIWRAAQLLVNPLEDYRSAATRLQDLLQLFPGSPEARSAEALLARLPVLEAASRSGAEAPAGPRAPASPEPRDRLAAARFLEYRLEDPGRASEAYRRLYQEDPGVVGMYAGLALLRLVALAPGGEAEAQAVLRELAERRLPPALEARFRARMALVNGLPEWRRLEAEARHGGDPDRSHRRQVELAAASFQDGPLAMAALKRIRDRRTQLEASLLAARVLKAAASPAPEAVGPIAFLDLAVQVAPAPAERARALLARGIHYESEQAPDRALADFRTASELAPGTPTAEEALFRRASLLLAEGKDLETARTLLERLTRDHSGGPRYLVASTKAPEVGNRIEAEALDRKAVREGARDPTVFLHTARVLAERYRALPQALENYRTFLRSGDDPQLLLKAHYEAAEVLVRMQKPEEAVLMLERVPTLPRLSPPAGEVLAKIGAIHEVERGDLESARKAYQAALAERPAGETERQVRGGLQRIQGLESADQHAIAATTGTAAPGELEAIRAEYLTGRRKDLAAAAEALRAAADRAGDPARRAALLYELARLEDRERKRPREAAEAYRSFLELPGPGADQATAMLRLAEIEAQDLDRPEAAHELYTRFQRRFPSHAGRLGALVADAGVLERLNRVQEAVQIYQNIIDTFPRSGSDEKALDRLAHLKRTYFASFQEAVDAYRELVARFPFSTLADDAQYQIGRIFEVELGDLVSARREYELLLQRYPSSEWYARAQQGLARIARR